MSIWTRFRACAFRNRHPGGLRNIDGVTVTSLVGHHPEPTRVVADKWCQNLNSNGEPQGGEPDSSVHQLLPSYRVLHMLEQQLGG